MTKLARRCAVLLVAALFAVGCSGSSEGESGATPTEPDSTPMSTPAPETEEPATEEPEIEDQGVEPTQTEDAPSETPEPIAEEQAADEESAAPVVLTATDTGVTAETIKIAATFPDLSVLGRDNGDLEAKFQVAVDAVNQSGGIIGRQIDLIFSTYVPMGDADAEALCVRNVEDERVFAVVGILLREMPLCYTEFNNTIVINAFESTAELFERSVAPLISTNPLPERLVEVNVDTLLDSGHLTPGMRIAVHGLATREDLHNRYLQALDSRGVEVVAHTLRTTFDVLAAESEVDIFAERWLANGAEAVLGSSPESGLDFVGAYERRGIDLPMLLPENTHVVPSLMRDSFGYSLAPLELAVVLVRDVDPASLYPENIAGVADCLDRFESASGEVVNIDQTDDGPDNLVPTLLACQVVDIFAAVARAAGPELTTESFAAAAESFGPIEVTGLVASSLGAGKFDVSDAPAQVGFFDPEALVFTVGGS